MQQSYIAQAVESCFLRIFSGGELTATNQGMRFDHGRRIATAPDHCNFIVFNNDLSRESDFGAPIGRQGMRLAQIEKKRSRRASRAMPGHDAKN
jgi:hypothetical protein